MVSATEVSARLLDALPGVELSVLPNGAASGPQSLLVGRDHLAGVACWLRDDPELRLDYCSNVTGVDWPERTEKMKVRRTIGGEEREVEETRTVPGFLEVVYHLYSMSRKHGPVVLRVRTSDRLEGTEVPSMTPVWRSCELQEREVFDLFGVRFRGHPDLRRLLMWDSFTGHPMRRDYVEPDDYEYEPTAHDHVLERATAHRRAPEAGA